MKAIINFALTAPLLGAGILAACSGGEGRAGSTHLSPTAPRVIAAEPGTEVSGGGTVLSPCGTGADCKTGTN